MHQDYKQPDFYHFSQDSCLLADLAAIEKRSYRNVLDLCAGCGIIGIEFWFRNPNVENLYFLEKQNSFEDSLSVNTRNISNTKVSFFIQDLEKVEFDNKFDLILCNPPFFAEENSRLSGNENRNICRLLPKSMMHSILKFISRNLNEGAFAMMVLPSGNKDWEDALFHSMLKKQIIKKDHSVYVLKLFKGNIDKK